MIAQAIRADPEQLHMLAETPAEIVAERARRQTTAQREQELQEARMEKRAAAQAAMGVVHVADPRAGKSEHRQAARQRTFQRRAGGPPLTRSRAAQRHQQRRESTDAAITAHLPVPFAQGLKSVRATSVSGQALPGIVPKAHHQQNVRRRLRRKRAPAEAPGGKRARLNRARVARFKAKLPKPTARVKKTRLELRQAALARLHRHRYGEA